MMRHPICKHFMATLTPAHFAEYRNLRLEELVPLPKGCSPNLTRRRHVKPTTVIKELTLFATIIANAGEAHNIYIYPNPASAQSVRRPKKQEGHERTRRLQDASSRDGS
jgi:hypothetical protein